MVSTDLKPQLIPGYSAPEQYGFELSAGIPADVYGLATTVFRVLTGNPPPDSTSRTRNSSDLYVPADVAKTLPDHVAAALFNALQISPDKRTSSIAAFRDQLTAAPAVTALLQDEAPAQGKSAETNRKAAESTEKTPEPPKKKKNGKYILLVALAVFIVLLLIAGAVLLLLFPDLFGGERTPPARPRRLCRPGRCPMSRVRSAIIMSRRPTRWKTSWVSCTRTSRARRCAAT